jgi:hypothetical protein
MTKSAVAGLTIQAKAENKITVLERSDWSASSVPGSSGPPARRWTLCAEWPGTRSAVRAFRSVRLAGECCVLAAMPHPVLSENSIRLGIRIVRQNHRMIGSDACSPAFTRNVHHRRVQVAAPA